jgi:SAM-dependent methyltransferase
MGLLEKRRLTDVYRGAGRPEALPWHRDGPPPLLAEVVRARGSAGRALDLGCGAGAFSVWLARQGFEVTGVDFVPEALAMARARADEAGVALELVESDVLAYTPSQTFDLVLDCGCLHVLARRERAVYRQRLWSWLAPGADYVLVHFGRRHPLEWSSVGPRRRTPEHIRGFLGARMRQRAHLAELSPRDRPLPLARRVLLGSDVLVDSYWFTHQA